ncbi:MAG: M28 family peptidase [Candidatus Eremiobacteraeota bacterium]|nr:M28 family peptidase [Candidatus Eremiobacteraeota bacterium]
MNVVRSGALILTVFLTLGAAGGLRDYTAQSAMLERGYETTFMDIPSAEGALEHSRFLNSQAHYPGSPGDYNVALYMRDKLRSYGFEAELEAFRARVDLPKRLRLELLTSPKQNLDLREVPDPRDPDTSRNVDVPFNYGSGDGDVVAPLVYANRGLEDDYAVLQKAGVAVRGRLVLIRYGAQFRGLLAKRAQDHGALGVIFYSDPKDDGFSKGSVFPDGPYRPAGAVQRGTVSHDPLRIPTLPITAINATTLLSNMTGLGAPYSWDGSLRAPYALGTTKAPVHLHVLMRHNIQMIWNTIGKIEGSAPSQSVILGGHRDAWVYGVTDNGSGISTLLEAARGLGYLHKSGWRPKRTIIIAGWDAEEIGELGSTDYVHVHQSELRSGCIAYINADENVSGSRFGADAAAALAGDVVAATKSVTDPATVHVSLFDRWLLASQRATHNRHLADPLVETPGGGSDHEPFLFELGIPTAEAGFGGPLGVYHSAYDDLKFATTITDPGFALHRTMAQLLGVLAMRLADADAVPYRFTAYVPALREGAAAMEGTAIAMGRHPDLRPLRLSIERFARAAVAYDARSSGGNGVSDPRPILQAAQILNTTTYGRSGYARSAFPKIGAALAGSDLAAITAAFSETAAQIDQASALLR